MQTLTYTVVFSTTTPNESPEEFRLAGCSHQRRDQCYNVGMQMISPCLLDIRHICV